EILGEAWRRLSATRDHRFHASVTLLHRYGYLDRIQTRDGRGVRILKPNDTGLHAINFDELEARREFEYKKLAVMLNYASRFRKHCYRSFILSYFGEWSRNRQCGNCSRCSPYKFPRGARLEPITAPMSKPKLQPGLGGFESSTTIALKILSWILRVRQK